MSITPVGRVPHSATFSVPARRTPERQGSEAEPASAVAPVIEPVRGSAPFVAQQFAQETTEDMVDAPRWRERQTAYERPATKKTIDLKA